MKITDILNRIQKIDEQVLAFSNANWDFPKFKRFMAFCSHPPYWRQFLGLSLVGSLIFSDRIIRFNILILIASIFCSDQTCNIIKALVKRVRPDGLRNTSGSIWRKLGYYSFPSSHAANTFNFVIFAFKWFHYWGVFFLLLALSIAFSRVYRNNHYPSDVVAGALIGLFYGLVFVKFLI